MVKQSTVDIYKQLMKEWNTSPPNLNKCGQLLDKLKVALTSMTFLPTDSMAENEHDLVIARDILEVGAQWSIAMKNIPSFERYMAQLKTYYMDYEKLLPESAFKHQLLGLNLLCLLSQNRVAEFHTELELLSPSDIQSNLYIQHPVSLEQFLMEGSYNKVFLSRGNVPADSYNFFLDILLDTVRADIAACMEKAYHHIAIPEAARMLFLQNPAKVKEIAQKRGWKMASDNQSYVFTQEEKTTDDSIPAFELAQQAVEYAKELEMII